MILQAPFIMNVKSRAELVVFVAFSTCTCIACWGRNFQQHTEYAHSFHKHITE